MWGLVPNIAYFVTRCHKSELKWSCFRKSNYGQSAYHTPCFCLHMKEDKTMEDKVVHLLSAFNLNNVCQCELSDILSTISHISPTATSRYMEGFRVNSSRVRGNWFGMQKDARVCIGLEDRRVHVDRPGSDITARGLHCNSITRKYLIINLKLAWVSGGRQPEWIIGSGGETGSSGKNENGI